MSPRRSNPLKRRVCRRVGHDWAPWVKGWKSERRDCERCSVREMRLDRRSWLDKRLLVRRTFILGRLVCWSE